MKTMHSFNSRHINYIKVAYPEFVFPPTREECREALLKKFGKDIRFLSYYEHSGCVWFLEGEGGPGTDCRFDGTRFAGVWIPSKDQQQTAQRAAEKSAPNGYRAAYDENLHAMAREDCDTYTDQCNGSDEEDE